MNPLTATRAGLGHPSLPAPSPGVSGAGGRNAEPPASRVLPPRSYHLMLPTYLMVAVLALLLAGACTKPRPPQPPQPPQPPAPTIQYPELLVRQSGGTLTRGGQPFLVFGAIPCWDGEEIDHNGWPGFDQNWINYTRPYGANAYHLRLGPAATDGRWPNGLNYQRSPYVNDDPAQGWDEAWWNRVRKMVEMAGDAGAVVEVDLIDGWACKHASWGDFAMPWGAADIEACTNRLTDTHKAFLRKAVHELGCYANVIWQDGNEVGVSGRYDPRWSLEMVALVRQYEQDPEACGVVHMFGTNSGHEVVEAHPSIDYTSTHSGTGIDGPHFGKYRQNNEHNPYFSPEQEHALYCAARNVGQAWWFWRGGMSADDMTRTLELWASGCDGMGGGSCPFDVPVPTQIRVKPHGTDYYDATPLVQNRAYCRSIDSDREACPIRPEGDPFREDCEVKAMGGRIEWNLEDVVGDIAITVRHRGYGIQVSGSGSARVRCTFPAAGGEDRCRDAVGGELRISR